MLKDIKGNCADACSEMSGPMAHLSNPYELIWNTRSRLFLLAFLPSQQDWKHWSAFVNRLYCILTNQTDVWRIVTIFIDSQKSHLFQKISKKIQQHKCVKNGSGHNDLSGKVIFMFGGKHNHEDGLFSQNKQRLMAFTPLTSFSFVWYLNEKRGKFTKFIQ